MFSFFDIFLGGFGVAEGGPTKILLGNKNNKFSLNQMYLIPNVKGFDNVMDVIKVKDYLFVVRTGSGQNFYQGALIQQVSIKTMKTQPIILPRGPRLNLMRTKVVSIRLNQDEYKLLEETQETLRDLGTSGNISDCLRLILKFFDIDQWKSEVIRNLDRKERQ